MTGSLAAIKVKKGPFGEHSPMLNDISHSVPTWAQVAKGMVRMYKVILPAGRRNSRALAQPCG